MYSRSGNSDLRYSDRQPPPMPQSQNRFVSSTSSNKTTPSDPYRSDDVIYIPVRVEETGQVLTRPPKKATKPSSNGISSSQMNTSVQRFNQTNTDGPTKTANSYESNKRYENKTDPLQGPRRRKRSVKGSAYGDDVEDALKRFDYLNDYSVEEGSRSSRYAAN